MIFCVDVIFNLCPQGFEDLGKLQPAADVGIFVGSTPSKKGYRIYNKRTGGIIETIHVQFDELSEPMAPVKPSTGHAPSFMTTRAKLSFPTPYVPPSKKEYDILFQPLFDEYFNPPPRAIFLVPAAVVAPRAIDPAGSPLSTTTDQDVPSANNIANENVPSPATTRSDDQIMLFNAWVLIGKALTALADVPSSFTATTKTTSTLPPPPPPPLQQSTVHQDICIMLIIDKLVEGTRIFIPNFACHNTMSSSAIPILADSTSDSVGSSNSLVILSDTKTEVMTTSTVLLVIALEAEAVIVILPTDVLDFVLEYDPPEAPLSSDHAPVYFSHATSTLPADLTPALRIIPHAFGGPSRKRCRSPTTSPPTAALVLLVLSFVPVDCLSPRKRFRGSPVASLQEDTIEAIVEAVVEPVIPHVHPKQNVRKRLDEQEDVIGEMVTTSEGENTALRARVMVMELGAESLRVSLRTARTGRAEMKYQVRDTAKELRQSQIARFHDKERIRRIKDYLCRFFDYHM
nr:hypothetical protein [Tanacetum cinerariifolium]